MKKIYVFMGTLIGLISVYYYSIMTGIILGEFYNVAIKIGVPIVVAILIFKVIIPQIKD